MIIRSEMTLTNNEIKDVIKETIFLESMLSEKGVLRAVDGTMRAGEGKGVLRAGKGTIRAGQNF